MKDLKWKLSQKYENADEIYELLKKFNLDKVAQTAIQQIDRRITNNKVDDLPKISGIILNDINVVISTVKDSDDKRKLEYFLSDLFQDYISQVSIQPNSQHIIKEIIENIRTACEYRGYNYKELERLLSLEKQTVVVRKVTNELYYEWQREEKELDEIAKDLADKKYIYSVKEFRKLFKPAPIYVRFNKAYKDEIIVFFQILKEKKLIIPRGKGNSGHFSAFVKYAMDNENNFFIQNRINKEHERIKKNGSRHMQLKKKIERILFGNIKERGQ
jgi:hypothetical protein